jgi:RNA polymerase sigma factor (sigma-70 family)
LEASALTHASQRGLLARRSPLLKLQGDGRLIAMARGGNAGAFETIVDRYQGRLLGFCRQMLGSTEDAEDVLQEVFVNAYRAMLADEREINLRPWLYRIARNRCLNHLRKPTADAQESMDMVPVVEAAATAEKVHNREEFRQLLTDVGKLPETQRTALLLREMDAMSYEEIASTMDTSVPSVKSLLVRARISLAEASQARQLTCGEVRLELAEAAEGLRKVNGPVRRHVRDCEECADFRSQVRSNDKVLAALFPAGPLLALKAFIASKLGLGGAGGGATGSASAAAGAGATATATGAGAGAVGTVGAALGGGGAAGSIGAVGGAIGSKAVAGVVTAAALTAGAVGVKEQVVAPPDPTPKVQAIEKRQPPSAVFPRHLGPSPSQTHTLQTPTSPTPAPEPALTEPAPPAAEEPTGADAAAPSTAVLEGSEESATVNSGGVGVTGAKPPTGTAGAPTGGDTVVVTVGTPPPAEPPAEEAPPPPPPPEESAPPTSEPPPPSEAPSDSSAGGSPSASESAS